MTPFPHSQQSPFPSLHLYPLNDSFVPKQIVLSPPGVRVKIGRQTNAKTVPGERNGYFDSKVLSRQHAEVWEEGGKIYIKDVKSSNGTFINGERLSQEGIESEVFELKSDDTVEFGIDIVGEDNKTIIHHKVAALVKCVFTPEDIASLPPHQSHQHPQHPLHQHHPHGPANPFPTARRPSHIQSQQLSPGVSLGGMGGGGLSGRAGKSGLTFDHILSRLQTELQKSRETGAELSTLTSVMTDIHDTLGGGAPSTLPVYPHPLPPVRPPSDVPSNAPAPPSAATSQPSGSDPALQTLQSQLQETQSTLSSHVNKVRELEGILQEHDAIKREVAAMKDLMEERKREVEVILNGRIRTKEVRSNLDDDDDDDDARSVATVVPDHGDETREHEAGEEDDHRRERSAGLRRPRTPEPTGHGLDEDDEERTSRPRNNSGARTSSPNSHAKTFPDLHAQNALLATRLETLASQLDSALSLSRNLQSQAAHAQSTISLLEAKVGMLEAKVDEQKRMQEIPAESEVNPSIAPEQPVHESGTSDVEEVKKNVWSKSWDQWRTKVEGEWNDKLESWEAERQRLRGAVKEWESRMEVLERRGTDGIGRLERAIPEAEDEEDEEEEPIAAPNGHADDSDSAFIPLTLGPRPGNKLKKRRPLTTRTGGRRKGSGDSEAPLSPSSTGSSSSSSPSNHASASSSTFISTPEDTDQTSVNDAESDAGRSSSFMTGKPPGAMPITPIATIRSASDKLANGVVGSDGAVGSGSGSWKGREATFSDNPLPYLSAAGVVVVGLAAWAVVNRAKD